MKVVIKGSAEADDDASMTESTVVLTFFDGDEDDESFLVTPKIKVSSIETKKLAMPQQKVRIPKASDASLPGKRS